MSEKVIIKARENPMSCGCITYSVLSLGLYLLIWATRELTVTNKRVVWTTGLFGRSEKSIPLNRVTDVGVTSGLMGQMIGYGDVRIESAGGPGTEIVASNLSNPKQVRDAIISQTN